MPINIFKTLLYLLTYTLLNLSCNSNRSPETKALKGITKQIIQDTIVQTKIDTVFVETCNWAVSQTLSKIYVGVTNPLYIKTNLPQNEIEVSAKEKHVQIFKKTSFNDGLTFDIRAKKTLRFTLQIFYNSTEGKELLEERKLSVWRFHDPTPIFSRKRSGLINKKTVLAQSVVAAELWHSRFDLKFVILSFTLTTINKTNNSIKEIHSDSYVLTKEQKKALSELNSGDKFYIENIIAKDPSGRRYELSTMAFQIE